MHVTQEVWDYVDGLAMEGISFGCTLKWIKEAMDRDDLTDKEKLDEVRSAMRLNAKKIDDFISGRMVQGVKDDK